MPLAEDIAQAALKNALKNALSSEDFVRFQQIWVRTLQPRLTQLSTREEQVILPDVGHDIPGERPESIVNAVRKVYAATEPSDEKPALVAGH
jgi:hypothetical protein